MLDGVVDGFVSEHVEGFGDLGIQGGQIVIALNPTGLTVSQDFQTAVGSAL